MSVTRRPDLKKLQERIGYQFRNKMLLNTALTHSSAAYGHKGVPDYERLEFLGDRVLGLAVAEHLFQTDTDAPEGQLARRYNKLVNKDSCAEVAEHLDLGAYIKMGDSEALAGGRKKRKILADACEALLGAIYLDGGWEPVKGVIVSFWASRATDILAVPLDAKTTLQEWVQGRGETRLPRYVKIASAGPDHAPSFIYEVKVEGLEPARGTGSSRQRAEQAAAQTLLLREGVWDIEP
ncbi:MULTISPECIES: ribonuclease III [Rhodomicrobium]|uniref:ribonuclease III n=1 Tax=Rhodomicrobium TaxID=1068 RepID=UPI000B4B7D62|nr:MULTISPECIES: ribonuclease III [Rhodomicrobium]